MFSHVTIGSADLARARPFYDALFAAIGGRPAILGDDGRLIYAHAGAFFLVLTPIDGRPATVANGGTIGFAAPDPDAVDAWHAAGLAHGGTDAADPPGWREGRAGRVYLAYLRDPDGNKLAAAHRPAAT